MVIDISACKKFWAGKKYSEPINKFVATHDINMLIGYVEQLQKELKEALKGKDTGKAGE